MEFGICTGWESARQHLEAGFAYAELPASWLASLEPFSADEFANVATPATNLFFPGGISLWQPKEGEKFEPIEYATKLFERAATIGISVMVVGSGRQRNWPSEITNDRQRLEVTEGFARVVAATSSDPRRPSTRARILESK